MFRGQGIGSIILIIAALWLASLACRLGAQPATNTPTVEVTTPVPAIATQSPEIQSPTQTVAVLQQSTPEQPTTVPTTNTGTISITIDENQLNTMVANELNKQDEPQLVDPKIRLQSGQILVSGEVNRSGLKASFSGTLTVDVTPDGRLHYNIISASLGPLPLPQAMRDQVATQLNDAMATPQTKDGQQIFVESVNVGNGVMTITGHIR
jgi:hypothetical protein